MTNPVIADESFTFDETVDVLVVGLGGAGASAAIEAARAGSKVLVIDRYVGGGATARSGGVIYMGGGSRQQQAAGYADTPAQMFDYLARESQGCVSDEVLRAFCEGSLEQLHFLEDLGVPFPPRGEAPKTSYPENDVTLYFSGNELCPPYSEVTRPIPRGHRVLGKSLSGYVLDRHLRRGAVAAGASIRLQTRATRLIRDAAGSVIGAEIREFPAGRAARAHARYTRVANSGSMLSRRLMVWALRRAEQLERKHARTRRVRARGGVVLAAGGFIFNRDMLNEHAPNYRRAWPLGTVGDDGGGIQLGLSAGGTLDHMQSVGAWRFINPPVALVEGVLVSGGGERICNEELYGSSLGTKIADDHEGRAWLILDAGVRKRVLDEIVRTRKFTFQTFNALISLFINRERAGTLTELEQRCGMPEGALAKTLLDYSQRSRTGAPDPLGKSQAHFRPLETGPYYAVNCGFDASWSPTPCITLGGLRVDGLTARVEDERGDHISGLYAAGRCAVGICSTSYVSGLSLSDAIFSGRNAGRHAAARAASGGT